MSTKSTILCSRQKDLRGGRGREADTESRWQKLSGRGREKSFPTKHIAELRGTLPSWKTRRWEKTTLHRQKKKPVRNQVLFQKKDKKESSWLVLTPLSCFPGQPGQGFWVSPWQRSPFHSTLSAQIDSATDTRRDLSIYKPQRNGLLSKILPAPKAGNLKGIVTGISLLPFSLPRWHGEGWALVCELLAW